MYIQCQDSQSGSSGGGVVAVFDGLVDLGSGHGDVEAVLAVIENDSFDMATCAAYLHCDCMKIWFISMVRLKTLTY
jgi:hypothetical protein